MTSGYNDDGYYPDPIPVSMEVISALKPIDKVINTDDSDMFLLCINNTGSITRREHTYGFEVLE
jgi:hypothetical protein